MKQTSGRLDTYITHCKLMNWHSGFLCQSPARCVNTSQCSSARTTLRLKNSSQWIESPDLNLAGGSLNKAFESFKLNVTCEDEHINNVLFKHWPYIFEVVWCESDIGLAVGNLKDFTNHCLTPQTKEEAGWGPSRPQSLEPVSARQEVD